MKELEQSLLELHQIFLDMAVLVEAQVGGRAGAAGAGAGGRVAVGAHVGGCGGKLLEEAHVGGCKRRGWVGGREGLPCRKRGVARMQGSRERGGVCPTCERCAMVPARRMGRAAALSSAGVLRSTTLVLASDRSRRAFDCDAIQAPALACPNESGEQVALAGAGAWAEQPPHPPLLARPPPATGQGEMLDNIEKQVHSSVDYVAKGTSFLQSAKKIQHKTRKLMVCCAVIIIIIVIIVVLAYVKPWEVNNRQRLLLMRLLM